MTALIIISHQIAGVMPGWSYTQPNSPLRALSCGTPVLSFALPTIMVASLHVKIPNRSTANAESKPFPIPAAYSPQHAAATKHVLNHDRFQSWCYEEWQSSLDRPESNRCPFRLWDLTMPVLQAGSLAMFSSRTSVSTHLRL